MRKLYDRHGETLVETLVALLIIMFSILFLTGSVITTARVNAKMRKQDNSLHYGASDETSTDSDVIISTDLAKTDDDQSIKVKVYTENDYRYYTRSIK